MALVSNTLHDVRGCGLQRFNALEHGLIWNRAQTHLERAVAGTFEGTHLEELDELLHDVLWLNVFRVVGVGMTCRSGQF